MNFSRNGIDLLEQLEAFSEHPYKDIGGVDTIGYGTVMHPDTPAHMTPAIAEMYLLQATDVTEHALTGLIKVLLNQNQYDALVIFVYNIGVHAFAQSTMLKLINQNDLNGAAQQFVRWVYAKGHPSAGLLHRRNIEKDLFEKAP